MNEQLKKEVECSRVIAILRGVEREAVLAVAQALYDGGIRLLELTFSQGQPQRWAETAALIEMLRCRYESRMFIGAGTVTSPELVELTAAAGGQFIVSPDTQEAVIRLTREKHMVSMPGAMTATEIVAAHRYGADFVKVFPAGVLGSRYFSAVCAPVSQVKLLAVGGVGAHNAAEYIRAGAVAVGAGGELVDRRAIAEGRYGELTDRARSLLAAVQGIA